MAGGERSAVLERTFRSTRRFGLRCAAGESDAGGRYAVMPAEGAVEGSDVAEAAIIRDGADAHVGYARICPWEQCGIPGRQGAFPVQVAHMGCVGIPEDATASSFCVIREAVARYWTDVQTPDIKVTTVG